MAYNEELAARIRSRLTGNEGLSERKMFGGIGFMLHGNMACGVIGEMMIVRVGPQAYPSALEKPFARVFDFTGRPMNGWLQVAPEGLRSDDQLGEWVAAGLNFARTLPPK